MSDDDSSTYEEPNLFQEPDGYYQEEKEPTFQKHRLRSGESMNLRLVGHNPLWGHILWNAGKTISDYLEDELQHMITGKYVLEFGAGAGLPSIVCALKGALGVVVSDYPDIDLIDNLKINIERNRRHNTTNLVAEGYLWGNDTATLKAHLPSEKRNDGFDLLILADLLFNHSEHESLARSIAMTLGHGKDSCALVFFTPYRPWLLDKDLDFFRIVKEHGFVVEKILEKLLDEVLFETDPGDEALRKTVFGYKITWA